MPGILKTAGVVVERRRGGEEGREWRDEVMEKGSEASTRIRVDQGRWSNKDKAKRD